MNGLKASWTAGLKEQQTIAWDLTVSNNYVQQGVILGLI